MESRLSVSTHSRPKAAAEYFSKKIANFDSFNTQPPEGGCVNYKRADENDFKFQHTAARRRLRYHGEAMAMGERGFNTQPPEGGCESQPYAYKSNFLFQHTAARRRLRELPLY